MNLPRSILVPTDFSSAASVAADYAVNLAKELGAKVALLHVYEVPVLGFPEAPLVATPDMVANIVKTTQGALDVLAKRYEDRGVTVTTFLKNGDAREIIHAVAEEVGADLLVMGTHGRRGISRALLGSVTEEVIRTSSRPVLTLRVPDKP
ncbi:MAG: universal stress protein [Polyangiaceae bacterium]